MSAVNLKVTSLDMKFEECFEVSGPYTFENEDSAGSAISVEKVPCDQDAVAVCEPYTGNGCEIPNIPLTPVDGNVPTPTTEASTQLAKTGDNLTIPAAEIGISALALGGVLLYSAHRSRRKSA